MRDAIMRGHAVHSSLNSLRHARHMKSLPLDEDAAEYEGAPEYEGECEGTAMGTAVSWMGAPTTTPASCISEPVKPTGKLSSCTVGMQTLAAIC